jgi:peptidylprolyl isomerase
MTRFLAIAAVSSLLLGALLSACGDTGSDDDGSQLDTGPGSGQQADAGPSASATTKVKKKDQTATAQAAASGVPTQAPAASGTPAAAGPITLENPQTLSNGVQIQELQAGTGAAATASSKVEIRYVGRLAATGAQFDATPGDTTRVFSLTALIPGFSSGVVGMKVGGKRRVLVPAAQGYGAAGRPPLIPPNSDLVFDIELVSIK